MFSVVCCPLCGKGSPRKRFDPSKLTLDIIETRMEPLGRRGFRKVSTFSAIEVEDMYVLELITDRSIAILNLLKQSNLISKEELTSELGLGLHSEPPVEDEHLEIDDEEPPPQTPSALDDLKRILEECDRSNAMEAELEELRRRRVSGSEVFKTCPRPMSKAEKEGGAQSTNLQESTLESK